MVFNDFKAYRFVVYEKHRENDESARLARNTVKNLVETIEVDVNNITYTFLIDERLAKGMLTIFPLQDEVAIECPCEWTSNNGWQEITNYNNCWLFYSDDLRDWKEYGTFDKDELIKWIKEVFPVSVKEYLDRHPGY